MDSTFSDDAIPKRRLQESLGKITVTRMADVSTIIVRGNVAYVHLYDGEIATIDSRDVSLVGRHRRWSAIHTARGCYAAAKFWDAKLGRRRCVRMHRLILGIRSAKVFCDHIDHNGLNNRRSNLRRATRRQNRFNARKRLDAKHSLYKGVGRAANWRRATKPWIAYICTAGERVFLGAFRTELGAARAYTSAAKRFHKEFACYGRM